jgi:hypothetical protein
MEKRDEEMENMEKLLAEGKMEIEKTMDDYLKLKVCCCHSYSVNADGPYLHMAVT